MSKEVFAASNDSVDILSKDKREAKEHGEGEEEQINALCKLARILCLSRFHVLKNVRSMKLFLLTFCEHNLLVSLLDYSLSLRELLLTHFFHLLWSSEFDVVRINPSFCIN